MPVSANKSRLRRPTAVGVHVFAGGFTIGVRAAGFDVLCHLEGDPAYGREVVDANSPKVTTHAGAESWPLDELADLDVDMVYGNPPCAAWSGNNPNSHVADAWKSDPRVGCTREHFEVLMALRPKVWLWESVTQVAVKGRELIDELTARCLENGYSVTEVFHDAKDLGVPQTRKRWFMVAHRVEIDFPVSALIPETSAVAALSKVKPVGPPAYDSGSNQSFDRHLSSIPAGSRLRNWQEANLLPEGGWEIKSNGHAKGRVGFGHVRLKAEGPATATVGYSMVHPIEHRFLTVNEVQALAGFPQSYRFPGGPSGAKQLDYIARGVCPPVGEWFARRVKEAVEANVAVVDPKAVTVDLISKSVRPVARLAASPATKTVKPARPVGGGAVGSRNSMRGKLGVPGSKPQDLDRRFDVTQLKEDGHGQRVHRDYAAHFFRWGWASRFVESRKTRVLDVGCGQELPLVRVLTASINTVPAAYVGVDLNVIRKKPGMAWVEAVFDGFSFVDDWRSLIDGREPFDLVSCFEVIEHMHEVDGRRLLEGVVGCMSDDGRFLLSTPVYDGKKMAANHIKEYTVDELATLIDEAGLEVVERFGTFASWNSIRKACTSQERDLLDETGRFYGGDVLACFLAPKYPDASRNNAWVLKKK